MCIRDSFLVAIVLSTTGLVPLAIAFLCAALATVLLRITDSMRAYTAIDWRLIILIGGMTAMGTAMGRLEETLVSVVGTARGIHGLSLIHI